MSAVPSFARLWLLSRLPAVERNDTPVDLSLDHRAMDLDAREAEVVLRYGRAARVGVDPKPIIAATPTPVPSPHQHSPIAAQPPPIPALLPWARLPASQPPPGHTFLTP